MAEEPKYLLPEPEKEVARLTEQDAVITHLMNGKRILPPIDLTRPGLRILDSGTADGLFLRAIQPLLTAEGEPPTLLGYDIMPSFFPPSPMVPPHTTLAVHDIAEPWPAGLQGTCDLVHQRFTIPGGTGAGRATPRGVVRGLCRLVRPGGWIQLVEMDVTGGAGHGPAMRDAWAVTGAFLAAAGAGTDYSKDMAGWLREEGFENVHDERVDLDVGARVKDTKWATRSAKILVEAFTGVVGACKSEFNPALIPPSNVRGFTFVLLTPHFPVDLVMKLDLPSSLSGSLDEIPGRAEEELTKQGGIYPLVFAFAQKPATT
ncbi:hypothetical protein KVR01_012597 [Diaporthe batatas]|uniref:uncharacterized protein n=1 Tax=Diaporthe batatas TaxID=748121 RepID=UPI001D049880|nr:uncharacterized protein KVR01_012597 [Diaporthe batatas]KAG8157555.1 hypothetical protein KVR01_012597 [Diaporthe batatas]